MGLLFKQDLLTSSHTCIPEGFLKSGSCIMVTAYSGNQNLKTLFNLEEIAYIMTAVTEDNGLVRDGQVLCRFDHRAVHAS